MLSTNLVDISFQFAGHDTVFSQRWLLRLTFATCSSAFKHSRRSGKNTAKDVVWRSTLRFPDLNQLWLLERQQMLLNLPKIPAWFDLVINIMHDSIFYLRRSPVRNLSAAAALARAFSTPSLTYVALRILALLHYCTQKSAGYSVYLTARRIRSKSVGVLQGC